MSKDLTALSLRSITRNLRHVLRSPKFEAIMGTAIFLIGLAELLEEFFAFALQALDVHHGLMLLGAVIALRGLVDVIEGIAHVAEARDGLAEITLHERNREK